MSEAPCPSLNSKEMCEFLDTVFVPKRSAFRNGRVLRGVSFRKVPFRKVHGLRRCILAHGEAPLVLVDRFPAIPGYFVEKRCAHCGAGVLSEAGST